MFVTVYSPGCTPYVPNLDHPLEFIMLLCKSVTINNKVFHVSVLPISSQILLIATAPFYFIFFQEKKMSSKEDRLMAACCHWYAVHPQGYQSEHQHQHNVRKNRCLRIGIILRYLICCVNTSQNTQH